MMFIFFLSFVLTFNLHADDFKSEQKNQSVKILKDQDGYIKKTQEKIRPAKDKDVVKKNTAQKKLIDGIDQAIPNLKKIASELPKGSHNRYTVLTKILNLYFEKAYYESKEEQKDYDDLYTLWEKNGRKTPEPKSSQKKSNKSWKYYVSDSESVIREFPKEKDLDEIIYNLGLAYQFLGQIQPSFEKFERLVKDYPKSVHFWDGHFFMGEYLFDNNNYSKSLEHYGKSVKNPDQKRLPWVFYKIGWAYYNMGAYDTSLKYWKQVMQIIDKNPSYKGLKDDVLKDMAFAFSELKQVDEAISYFRSHQGEDYIPKFLKLLAQINFNQGAFQESIRIWNMLLQKYPMTEDALEASQFVARIYFETNHYSDLVQQSSYLLTQYYEKSPWGIKNPDIIKRERQKILDSVLFYVKKIHQHAQKTNKIDDYALAYKAYDIYIRDSHDEKSIPEITEYLGDISYTMKNYEQSALKYKIIVDLGKEKAVIYLDKGNENIHQRSAKNMMDSYHQNAISDLNGISRIKADFKSAPKPISDKVKKFLISCDEYVKWYPQDAARVKNCEVYKGDIYYRLSYKSESISALTVLAKKYPRDKEGMASAENLVALLLLDKEKNRDKLKETVRDFSKVPEYHNSNLGKKLAELMNSLHIEEIEKEENTEKKAALYEALADGNDKLKGEALYSSARNYLKVKNYDQALKIYEKILSQGDGLVSYKPALIEIGKLSDQKALFQKASEYYLLYANKYPKEKEAPLAWQRSCQIDIAFDFEKAMTNCLAFAKANPLLSQNLVKSLIEEKIRRQDWMSVKMLIVSYYLPISSLTHNQKMEALVWWQKSVLQTEPQNKKLLDQIQRDALALSKSGNLSGPSLRYAGEMIFQQVQTGTEGFFQKKLAGGSVSTLQASIASFAKDLEILEKKFQPLFKSQDSYWSVAGFYTLGLFYEYFADQLSDPPGIEGATIEELKQQLKASIDQTREKSLSYFKIADETAKKFQVYSEYGIKVSAKMDLISGKKETFVEWINDPAFIQTQLTTKDIPGLHYEN